MREEVRTKYITGADGSKSAVRGFMSVEVEGDTTDELWGVIDLVVDSDISGIRKVASINIPGPKETRSVEVLGVLSLSLEIDCPMKSILPASTWTWRSMTSKRMVCR